MIKNHLLDLIYNSSSYGFNREFIINHIYGKKNLIVLIESVNGNVFGGFTSVGWKKGAEDVEYSRDDYAFLFSIRSS